MVEIKSYAVYTFVLILIILILLIINTIFVGPLILKILKYNIKLIKETNNNRNNQNGQEFISESKYLKNTFDINSSVNL